MSTPGEGDGQKKIASEVPDMQTGNSTCWEV